MVGPVVSLFLINKFKEVKIPVPRVTSGRKWQRQDETESRKLQSFSLYPAIDQYAALPLGD